MAAASEVNGTKHPPRKPDATRSDDWVALVRRQVEGLSYGTVQIVVHDHHVVQIDRTERFRLPPGGVASQRDA